jgi:hypothetical protein
MHEPYMFCMYKSKHLRTHCFFHLSLIFVLLFVMHDWVWRIESDVNEGGAK